jgi:NO-binding membrane sensor protein with MHYT domain
MASMTLKTSDGVKIPVKFHVMPTIASLAIVLLLSFVGLYVSSKDTVFCKTKLEIVDMFVKNSAELSQKQIRKLSTWHIFSIISTRSFLHIAGGGLLTGSGFCAMHYLGMWSMSFDGVIVWDKGIIASSVLIALISSTASLWVMFRLLSLYPQKELLRLGSAFLMGVAFCGMHFVGKQTCYLDRQFCF